MNKHLCITTLVEDTALSDGLLAEHGLSFWIEYGDKRILFDTGQSDILVKNAKALGIDLAEANAIVISHGHYDHTGGLSAVLDIAPNATVYLHPASIESKFSRKTSGVKSIGMPYLAKKAVQRCRVIWTVTPAHIFPGMSVTGQISRINSFEDVGGAFSVDKYCTIPDELTDDQSLFIESAKGLVVVLGCAHSGVINTLEYISNLTNRSKIYAVIGGMHLLNASKERIEKTISVFQEYNVQKIGVAHCTGASAVRRFSNTFHARCFSCSAGTRISFEKSSKYVSVKIK
ncbi:MAG: MBL fold metallo-hydrolase [Planctomycetes bacterium]|nr:MBL fold metallo-hydrolase [Planctomycetota bacterium]